MKMRLVGDIRELHKKYSVWTLSAIFLVSGAEAAAPLFQPWIPVYVFPLIVGALAVIGVIVRGIKQGAPDADQPPQ